MEKLEELHPIILKDASTEITDVLAGTEELFSAYPPEVACSGVGAAACKDGCISGCKDSSKTGGNCSESCLEGCKNGCKTACFSGKK